jgi:ribulose-5-phosphate 4-epimerase/fuculose-1-phosphate aldolase
LALDTYSILPNEFERLRAAGRRMYEGGLTTGTMGSMGIRLSGGYVAVTAAGTRLGFLGVSDLLVLTDNQLPVRKNGRVPVMDASVLAAALKAQPQAGTVIRVHSPYATALAHKGRGFLEQGAEHLECIGGVDYIPYRIEGGEGLAGAVAKALREHRAALVEGQGPFIWGKDIDDAVDHAEALEAAARVMFILDRDEV